MQLYRELIFCCLLITVISFRVQHTPGQDVAFSYVLLQHSKPALLCSSRFVLHSRNPVFQILLYFQHIDSAHQLRLLQHGERPTARLCHKQTKMGEERTAKLDELSGVENDVMDPKRKRSFPRNYSLLDRLPASSMETKQSANRLSKVVELPRRRMSPPPIDRISVSRLPMNQG